MISKADLLASQLHDEILIFRDTLRKSKKSATKGQLVNLLTAIVEYPVENTVVLSSNVEGIYKSAIEAKNLLMHANIQILIEESKKKLEEVNE